MKSKAPLMLMEQIVMLLVFALAAALCLQAFVRADELSHQGELLDQATLAAQSAAETVRQTRGDLALAAKQLGGQVDGDLLTLKDLSQSGETLAEAGCCLYIGRKTVEVQGLGAARIWIMDPEGQELFSLQVAWQEVENDA